MAENKRAVLPKDLMLGDWLMIGGLPFRVAQVTTPTIAGDLYDGFILEDGTEDAGDAIPITRHILEKIGFRQDAFTTMVLVTDKPERRVTYDCRLKTIVITCYDSTYGRRKRHTMLSLLCDDVHTLQHCFAICGIRVVFELKPEDLHG